MNISFWANDSKEEILNLEQSNLLLYIGQFIYISKHRRGQGLQRKKYEVKRIDISISDFNIDPDDDRKDSKHTELQVHVEEINYG
jgi:hypothetical protein